MDDGAPRRIVLVEDGAPRAAGAGPRVRRFRLARLAPSPRSELGFDRHARLERVAERESRPQPGEAR